MKLLKFFTTLGVSAALVACGEGTSGKPNLKLDNMAAMSGGVDGGGGKGILCGSQLVTLDLYEARLNGLNPSPGTGYLDGNLKFFGMEMAKHFAESLDGFSNPQWPEMILKEMNDAIISRFKDIAQGQRLPLTNDATIPTLRGDCSVVQIAVYAKDGTIYRDADYWSRLSPIEQTALVVHEWIYHRAREYGASDSDESRKVIGMIFSGKNPEPLLSPLWNSSKRFWCGAGIQGSTQEVYEIYGAEETRNSISGVALYFRAFKSAYLTSRTSAFLQGVSLDQFMKGHFSPVMVVAKNQLMSHEWVFEIAPDTQFSGNYSLRAYANGQTQPPYSHGFCKWE